MQFYIIGLKTVKSIKMVVEQRKVSTVLHFEQGTIVGAWAGMFLLIRAS